MMRTLRLAPLAALTVGLAAALSASPAFAQTGGGPGGPGGGRRDKAKLPVGLEATVGFGGKVYPGWIPVGVELDNRQAPLEGVRLVAQLLDSGRETVLFEAAREIDLPAGGPPRRHWLYLFGSSRAYSARVFLERDGRVLEEVARVVEAPIDVDSHTRGFSWNYGEAVGHLLVVSDESRTLKSLTDQRLDSNITLTVTTISPDELPDRWVGFDPVDLLVIAGVDLEKVPAAQRQAIGDWTRAGGVTLIAPSNEGAAGWFNGSLVRELIPGLRQASVVELPRLPQMEKKYSSQFDADERGFPLVALDIADATPVISEAAEGTRRSVPIVTENELGWGWVYTCAFDLGAKKYRNWDGMKPFFDEILQHVRGFDGNRYRQRRLPGGLSAFHKQDAYTDDERVREGVVRVLDASSLPSLFLIVPLVLAYIVVVGPVNYFVLKRQNAQMWVVGTVPVLAVAFTLITFFSGYVTKGVSTVVNRVTVLHGRLGDTTARESVALGIYAAAPSSFDVAFEGDLVGGPIFRNEESATGTNVRLIEGEAGFGVPGFPLRLWELGTFEAVGVRQLPGPLQVDEGDGAGDLPEFRNDTGFDVEGGLYLTPAGAFRVPPVSAGRRVTLEAVDGAGGRSGQPQPLERALCEADADEAERRRVADVLRAFGVSRRASSGSRGLWLRLRPEQRRVTVDGEDWASWELTILHAN